MTITGFWSYSAAEIRALYSLAGYRSITGTATLGSSDDGLLIDCDATAGAFTVNLPAAATIGKGRRVYLRKSDSTANPITIDANAAETINGALTVTLARQYSGILLICTGTAWAALDYTEYVGFSVALVTGSAVTAYQWNCDTFGSPGAELVLTKTDGSHLRRFCHFKHDNVPGGADATAAQIAADGVGTHADLTAGTWVDADVSGAGAAQVVRLRLTATANGPSWTATVFPTDAKAA